MHRRKRKPTKKKGLSKEVKLAGVAAAAVIAAMSFYSPAAEGADAESSKSISTTSSTVKAKQGSAALSKHMKDIRFCESTDNYRSVNKQSPSHTGAFQFADSTWAAYKTGYKHAKDAPASVQDTIAAKEYAKNGNSPWLASKPCWSKR